MFAGLRHLPSTVNMLTKCRRNVDVTPIVIVNSIHVKGSIIVPIVAMTLTTILHLSVTWFWDVAGDNLGFMMDDICKKYLELINTIDLTKLLKDAWLTDSNGITWDSYRDYFLYGDMFRRIKCDEHK